MGEYLLETNNLVKAYSKDLALNGVSIHIEKGAIYGLIGRNGAGKTTLMRIICGLARPTEGTVNPIGFANNKDFYKNISAVIESPALYPYLNAYDNLKLKCLAYGIDRPGYIEEKLKIVGLNGVKKKVSKYSLGMKQRLAIALALIGDPEFLLLDEPINGLDPQAIVEVRNLFERLNKENGITILISSHILEELAKVATQFAIIDKGQILEELTREELLTKGTNEVIVGCSDVDLAESALKSSGFTSIRKEGKESIVIGDSNADVASINKILIEKSISINSIGTKSEGIEDYYLRLTSRKV